MECRACQIQLVILRQQLNQPSYGWQPSHSMGLSHTCHQESPTPKVNLNKAKADTSTGKSSSVCINLSDSLGWQNATALKHTLNKPDQPQPKRMCGKKKQESKGLNSNSEKNLLNETTLRIGKKSEPMQLLDDLWIYQQMYTFDLTR